MPRGFFQCGLGLQAIGADFGQLRAARVVEPNRFHEGDATVVPSKEAFLAAVTPAGGAKSPDKTLIENELYDVHGCEAVGGHFAQTFKNPAAGTRVQGGDDEMAGQRSAHGNVGCFFIPDFADDEYLGILAKEMPGCLGETETVGLVDFGLHYLGNDAFNGILDGDDVAAAFFGEVPKACINGSGLARARGARKENKPVSSGQRLFELKADMFRKI